MSEKWWDMLDDELDDLFREASDKVEIPFDSSALDKLRQKIDFKPTPEPKPSQGFQKRWLALAGLLIFFGVALLYTFSKVFVKTTPIMATSAKSKQANTSVVGGGKTPSTANNLPNNQKSEILVDKNNFSNAKTLKEDSINANVAESKIALNETSTNTGNAKNKIKNKQTHKKSTKLDFSFHRTSSNSVKSNLTYEDNLLKNQPLGIFNTKPTNQKTLRITNKLNGDNSPIIKGENNTEEVDLPITSYSPKINKKQSKLAKSKFNSNQFDNTSVYQEINVPTSTLPIIPENKPTEEETLLKANFYNVNFLTNKTTKSLETDVESDSPTYVDAPPRMMKQPKFSRFGIRLAIAPDINSLEKLSSSVLGSSYGLLLEYRLNKRFIVQTGVTYSSKKYVGDFDYYHNWAGNWMAYHPSKPIDVDGGCKIIDVPLNIRFNIYQKPRHTFFIRTGISSYFIMNETYTYDYAWAPPKTATWSDKSSFYWSALNISAGIERKFNKNLTFQIEPYLKTPLKNVGRGGVSLYSSGLLFSTKYEF